MSENQDDIREQMQDINDEVIPNEPHDQKFRRLSKARVARALKAISLIGNLSARSSYDYTPEQVAKIEKLLLDEVNSAMARFKPKADTGPVLDW